MDNSRYLALSGDGKFLAENRMPGTVLWDVATAKKRAGLDTWAFPARFGAGGSLLLLGNLNSAEEPSEVWDLEAQPPRLLHRGTIWHA